MRNAPARFQRVAHRGSPRVHLENTLPGFLLALEHGADAIELDLHVTGDGVVVVHHDPVAQGTEIRQASWAAVQALDLGAGARVPRLDDVMQAVAGRATLYLELKGAGIEAAVLEVAGRHGGSFAVHSFDHGAVERARALAPDVPRGVLLDRGTEGAPARLQDAVRACQARDVWPHWSLVTPELMLAASEVGARVIAWTVNSADDARRLLALGAEGICTDDVRLLATL